ncbi:MAG TPA: flavodoxin family protein [Polyangia bacterium]
MKVVAFNGSARKQGNTGIMIEHVFAELRRAGIETEAVELAGEAIRGCAACVKCSNTQDRRCSQTGDIVNACIEKMLAADGVILAAPTYFADVPAEIKALIDRAGMVARVNGDLLRRKVGAAIVVARRGGAIHAFDTLNHFFFISQMVVPGSDYWNMGYGLERGDVRKDDEALETMRHLGENMAWLLGKLAR